VTIIGPGIEFSLTLRGDLEDSFNIAPKLGGNMLTGRPEELRLVGGEYIEPDICRNMRARFAG
jgi:hypothetical protein